MTQSHAFSSVSSLNVPEVDLPDKSFEFLQKRMLTYMSRLLKVDLDLDKEFFGVLYWMLNRDLANDYVKTIKDLIPEQKRPTDDESDLPIEDSWDFTQRCFDIIKLISKDERREVRIMARRLLKQRLDGLDCEGVTTIQQNISEFQKLFDLDDIEAELCLFLFVMTNWDEFQSFFEHHLKCNRYQGRKWLSVILNCRESQLVKIT